MSSQANRFIYGSLKRLEDFHLVINRPTGDLCFHTCNKQFEEFKRRYPTKGYILVTDQQDFRLEETTIHKHYKIENEKPDEVIVREVLSAFPKYNEEDDPLIPVSVTSIPVGDWDVGKYPTHSLVGDTDVGVGGSHASAIGSLDAMRESFRSLGSSMGRFSSVPRPDYGAVMEPKITPRIAPEIMTRYPPRPAERATLRSTISVYEREDRFGEDAVKRALFQAKMQIFEKIAQDPAFDNLFDIRYEIRSDGESIFEITLRL